MTSTEEPRVTVTGMAHREIAKTCQKWSGWDDLTVRFGVDPEVGTAWTDILSREMAFNLDTLVSGKTDVVDRVTPGFLKSEPILCGAMLHESAHARYTRWANVDEATLIPRYTNGEPATNAVVQFATNLDEPRIESRALYEAESIGSAGYSWTMRAASRAVVQKQAVLDPSGKTHILSSIAIYALRAGRMYSAKGTLSDLGVTNFAVPTWAVDARGDLTLALRQHYNASPHLQSSSPATASEYAFATEALVRIDFAISHDPVLDTELLDRARELMEFILGKDAGQTAPELPSLCIASPSPGESEESDEDGDDSLVITIMGDTEAEAEHDDAADAAESAEDKGGRKGSLPGEVKAPRRCTTMDPTAAHRKLLNSARESLTSIISPSESTTTTSSNSPSALIDPEKYAAWRAAGGTSEPQFFVNTSRTVLPAPPVEVAILVDISSSMDELQEPAGVLSWALASAAHDLRNYAGRGSQVKSTLIHWGDYATVIQKPGELLGDIIIDPCRDGTSAFFDAIREADRVIPGFTRPSPTPKHRLLVVFTDWHLAQSAGRGSTFNRQILALRDAGVHVLSVHPDPRTGGRWVVSDSHLRELRGILGERFAEVPFTKGREAGVFEEVARLSKK